MPSPSHRILVTGSRGFVGRNLIPLLRASSLEVRELNRVEFGGQWDGATPFSQVDLKADALIHLAARVHVMKEKEGPQTLELYRQANVEAFRSLLAAAADQGLKRVIFVSTAKVMGEETLPGQPFTDDMAPAPHGSYAVSKREAEVVLQKIAAERRLEFVTLRPPLIYGPGVKANFLALARAVERGIPIPVPAVPNRRSLLNVENLCSAILAAVRAETLPNREFLISDGSAVSTEELVRLMGQALGKPARVVRVPGWASVLLERMPIARTKWSRLSGSFEISDRSLAQWLNKGLERVPLAKGLGNLLR